MAVSKGPITGRWYSSLKDDLYQAVPRAKNGECFVVQSFHRLKNDEYIRKYEAFVSSVDFYIYYRGCTEKEHHEVITGGQKPRFDVDLDRERLPSGYETLEQYGDLIRNSIIISILEVLRDCNVPITSMESFIICTSHGPNKYSLHLILSNYMHRNHEEAKEFFRLITEKSKHIEGIMDMSEVVSNGVLDGQIYKSTQNFRIIGSGKRREDGVIVRYKSYVPYIELNGARMDFPKISTAKEELRLFRRASITDVEGCILIPIVLPLKEEFTSKVILPDGVEVDVLEYVDAFDPDSFDVGEVKGSLITLLRKRPSYCVICGREHTSTHPFLTITKYGEVRFYCRRKTDDNWRLIGNITGVKILSNSNSPSGSQETTYDPEEDDPHGEEHTPIPAIPRLESHSRINTSEEFACIHNDNGLADIYREKIPKERKKKLYNEAPRSTYQFSSFKYEKESSMYFD
jgi:hypothetical protein